MSLLAIQLDQAFPPLDSNAPASSPPHPSLAPYLSLVDAESATRITRFRLLEDAQRCLLGRLLPRYLISTHFGIPWSSIAFGRFPTGRPFAIQPDLPKSFDYNVSHDSNWVVMGWSVTELEKPLRRVGVDVMRVRVPWEGATVDEFVEGLLDQLTPHEQRWLSSSPSVDDKLHRTILLWTLKESYVKALGDGLRFDLQRLEFRFAGDEAVHSRVANLDGVELHGWSFVKIELDDEHVVAVAVEHVGDAGQEVAMFASPQVIQFAQILAIAGFTPSVPPSASQPAPLPS